MTVPTPGMTAPAPGADRACARRALAAGLFRLALLDVRHRVADG